MIRCEVCGHGIREGVNLHRQNEKGVPGIWRCEDCNFKPLDPEVQAIVCAISPQSKGPIVQ